MSTKSKAGSRKPSGTLEPKYQGFSIELEVRIGAIKEDILVIVPPLVLDLQGEHVEEAFSSKRIELKEEFVSQAYIDGLTDRLLEEQDKAFDLPRARLGRVAPASQ